LMSCSYDPPLVEFEFWYGWPGITQVHIQMTQVHIQMVGHPYFLFLQEQIKGIIITTHTTHRYRCSHTTNTSLCTKCHLQHILSPTSHAQSVTHNTLTTNLPMLTRNTNNTYANGVSYCKKKLYVKNSINTRILFSKSKGGVGWKTRRSVWEEAPEHEA
jgi:hypothetical protein